MSQKDFYHFLDHSNGDPRSLTDPEERELAQLMKEVENLDVPGPGQDYWNQFNHEFQNRLATNQNQNRFFGKWTRITLIPALSSVLIIVFALFLPLSPKPQSNYMELDQLNSESLALLSQSLDSFDDYTIDEDITINVDKLAEMASIYEDELSYESLESLNPNDLKSLWDAEG